MLSDEIWPQTRLGLQPSQPQKMSPKCTFWSSASTDRAKEASQVTPDEVRCPECMRQGRDRCQVEKGLGLVLGFATFGWCFWTLSHDRSLAFAVHNGHNWTKSSGLSQLVEPLFGVHVGGVNLIEVLSVEDALRIFSALIVVGSLWNLGFKPFFGLLAVEVIVRVLEREENIVTLRNLLRCSMGHRCALIPTARLGNVLKNVQDICSEQQC